MTEHLPARLRISLWLSLVGSKLMLIPIASFASSIYYADSDRLEIRNDSVPITYLSMQSDPSCKVYLFTDNANIYPWGKDSPTTTADWPLSDEDWKDRSWILVSRLRAWIALSANQRQKTFPDNSCTQLVNSSISKRIANEKACSSQGKGYRDTEQGRLCLSDFEYAQIKQAEQDAKDRASRYEREHALGADGCPVGTQRFTSIGYFGAGRKDLGCMTPAEGNMVLQQERMNNSNTWRNTQESIQRNNDMMFGRRCAGTSINYGSVSSFTSRCY